MAFGRPGEQLRLFAPVSEIMSSLKDKSIGSYEIDNLYEGDVEGLMMRKTAESFAPKGTGHGSGVARSIMENGFQGHVQMNLSDDKPELWEGHHRLAAAEMVQGLTTAYNAMNGFPTSEQFVGLDNIDPHGRATGEREALRPSLEQRYPQNPNWGRHGS